MDTDKSEPVYKAESHQIVGCAMAAASEPSVAVAGTHADLGSLHWDALSSAPTGAGSAGAAISNGGSGSANFLILVSERNTP